MKLEGVRVVDLTAFLPGPHLTMMIADHGAKNIKVESPGEGDPTRHIGFQKGGWTTYFRNTNAARRAWRSISRAKRTANPCCAFGSRRTRSSRPSGRA